MKIMKSMKVFNKSIVAVFITLVALVSCKDDDKTVFNLNVPAENKAAYVRLTDISALEAVGDLPSNSLTATFDDPEGNVLSHEAFVVFQRGGTNLSDTVSIAQMTSFPTSIEISFTDLAMMAGIDISDIAGGDFIRILGESTREDGRVFDASNFSGNVLGTAAQRQSYNFIIQVECSPITDVNVAGTWLIDIFDSFGDGWDGARLVFTVNGDDTSYTITDGFEGNFSQDVPDGAELLIRYFPGNFESEHTFDLTSPEGPYGSYGPAPSRCVN